MLSCGFEDRHLQYLAARQESWAAQELVRCEAVRLQALLEDVVGLYRAAAELYARSLVGGRPLTRGEADAVLGGVRCAVVTYTPHLHWPSHIAGCIREALESA